MLLKILPESFITNSTNITNTNKCFICSEVLHKHKETIIENTAGCLFKITFNNEPLELEITEYLECVEFTAPKGTIIVSNKIFDNLLIDFIGEYYADIDIFVPPQASKVVFKIENRDIFCLEDIKGFLEHEIGKKYKFLQINQELIIENYHLTVKELEPYQVCLINNTDLEVEFDVPVTKPPTPPPLEKENIVNDLSEDVLASGFEGVSPIEPSPILSREQLRQKRLVFYSK